MEFEIWERYYRQIINDMGYSEEKDMESARLLAEMLKKKKLVKEEDVRRLLFEKDVFVIGSAPQVERDLKEVELRGTIIAADGATTKIKKIGRIPDIIVTDLDGIVEDQIFANERGSIVLIHAHGDNIELIKRWVLLFPGLLMGTTQCKPIHPLKNYGGFTDGDRCVFLADHFGASRICILGMGRDMHTEENMNEIITIDKRKLKKFTWANVLIALLDNPSIEFY